MRVAVIGTGGMGSGLARHLASKHDVAVGSRDPQKAASLAGEIGAPFGGTYGDAAKDAEVVILAVPWAAIDETLDQLGDLTARIVVDVTNPYVGGQLRPHENSSNAEEIQKKLPGARVVKGWNTVFSPVVNAGPSFDGEAASVLLAADDQAAKESVAGLARDIGYDPVDCGPLPSARDLERLLSAYGAIGHNLEWGSWAIRVLKRS
ncbi:MAG: NADPH-dependent F420 reductase [Actinomycetota bacterium]